MKKAIGFFAFAIISSFSVRIVMADAQTPTSFYGQPPYVTPGVVAGKLENGATGLQKLFSYVTKYRNENGGNYPKQIHEILSFIIKSHKSTDKSVVKSEIKFLFNEDNKYTQLTRPEDANFIVSYLMGWRPNGSPIGSVKPRGTRDVIAYTNIYFYQNSYKNKSGSYVNNPIGYYLYIDENEVIEKTPYDLMVRFPINGGLSLAFPTQPFVPIDSITYAEFWADTIGSPPPFGKKLSSNRDEPVLDNGGPESLVQLSRRENFHSIYGIDRSDLWQQFDPSQVEFILSDVQAGGMKLGLDTQVQRLPLSQLQKNGSPALLFLKDDGRIVTLTSLDDDRAVVIDRGITRNVKRSVLEARYSGEALVPTKALTQQTGIVADDAVRQVQLKSLEDEVPQAVTLRNTGKVPVTLQLEYPLLGVTEAKLSKDTLAPGETATLDLKIKWRSILKAPTQNVLVSLQTSDPIVPRLQLAILLTPPPAATK